MEAFERFLEVLGWITIVYFLIINAITILIISASFIHHRRQKRHQSSVELGQLFHSELNLPVSIIVPAYREELTIAESVKNLLNLRYPNFEVVVVSDGSPDRTLSVLRDTFDLRSVPEEVPGLIPTKAVRRVYRSPAYPQLMVIDKENGGKADANNVGINAARNPYVLAIDADSILEEDSILKMVRPFIEDSRVIAVGGMIRIVNGCDVKLGRVVGVDMPQSMLARFQMVEYLRAFLFGRMGWSAINSLLVISGAFGAFRRDVMIDCGGFRKGSLGEDMELVVSMHDLMRQRREPYRIVFTPDPVCWTEVPEDLKVLRRQRLRWQKGTIDAMIKFRRILFNPKYGAAGMLGFPYYLFVETLSAPFEILGYLIFAACILTGHLNMKFYLLFSFASVVLGIIQSIMVLLLEEIGFRTYPKISHLARLIFYAVIENFGYRQLNVWWRFWAIIDKIRGGGHEWGVMTRKGFGGAKPAPATS